MIARILAGTGAGTGAGAGATTDRVDLGGRRGLLGERGATSALGGVGLEAAGPRGVTQLVECDLLDLADPLPRQAELATDLVERAQAAIVQADAQPDHFLLPLRERGQHDLDVGAEHARR